MTRLKPAWQHMAPTKGPRGEYTGIPSGHKGPIKVFPVPFEVPSTGPPEGPGPHTSVEKRGRLWKAPKNPYLCARFKNTIL